MSVEEFFKIMNKLFIANILSISALIATNILLVAIIIFMIYESYNTDYPMPDAPQINQIQTIGGEK